MLSEVQEICDRVGVISGGKLLVQSTVAELRGASSLLLRAEPLDAAFPAVCRVVGEHAAMLTAGGIRIESSVGAAPALARAVVEAGADLLELRVDEKSLEEVFFEMTQLEAAK
jgi:ABC-2 type transport system ATP-binding protein